MKKIQLSGNLQFMTSIIEENQLVEYQGGKLLILDEVRIEDKQMSELDIVKMVIDEMYKLFGNCVALKEAKQ
ncbi:hypothetical protein BBH88_17750 [Planococcus antarcticus DSM 14505]|uniref:Uncharacterized protein n=1 Tax=Planococcus antarcticus DSM 14505 TaxID=1185653 RepID=A0ABM6D9D4_9BACL|nr:hypothetical protein [Planococcus antarcticus]ANU11965.1 hypothetical protein BBH88_17750 [Planococcus antarcticus DSM 14505]